MLLERFPAAWLQGNPHATSAGGAGQRLLVGGGRATVANLRTPRREANRPHVSADRAGQDGRQRP
jgi:hypothetical protein